MLRSLGRVFLAGLVGLLLFTGGAVAAEEFAEEELEPEEVRFVVTVEDDGTADWRMEQAIDLEDETTRHAFAELQADIEDDPDPYLEQFIQRIGHTVETAEATTGREMVASDFEVEAFESVTGSTGVVAYSFTWVGFAAVEDGRLAIGDAMSGFELSADESLLVTWPGDHEVVSVEPEPTREFTAGVLWEGPLAFGSDEPRIVTEGDTAGIGLPIYLGGTALVILVVAGLAVGYWRRYRTGDGAEPVKQAAETLLTNEEQVLAVLENHDGRVKQQLLATELDWTDAKTSYVVRGLEEENVVEVYRIGRENVVALPGEISVDVGERSAADTAE